MTADADEAPVIIAGPLKCPCGGVALLAIQTVREVAQAEYSAAGDVLLIRAVLDRRETSPVVLECSECGKAVPLDTRKTVIEYRERQ